MARGDATVNIVARDQTSKGFQSAQRNAVIFAQALSGRGGPIGALGLMSARGLAVGAALSALGLAFNRTVRAGAEFTRIIEDSTLQFDFLSRKTREVANSADFARTHMAALVKLSRESPLDLTGIVQASTVMENFGGAVLNNERFLKRFIDTVSILRTSIGQGALGVREIGRQLGQSMTLLASGRRAGQDLRVLQQRGVLTIEARREMERTADLVKAGALSSEQAFVRLREIVFQTWEAFAGGAEAASNTLSGLEEKAAEAFKDMSRNLLEVTGLTGAWKLVLHDVWQLMEDWIDQLTGEAPLREGSFLASVVSMFEKIAFSISYIKLEWAAMRASFAQLGELTAGQGGILGMLDLSGRAARRKMGEAFWPPDFPATGDPEARERLWSLLYGISSAEMQAFDAGYASIGEAGDAARHAEWTRQLNLQKRIREQRAGVATFGAPPGRRAGDGAAVAAGPWTGARQALFGPFLGATPEDWAFQNRWARAHPFAVPEFGPMLGMGRDQIRMYQQAAAMTVVPPGPGDRMAFPEQGPMLGMDLREIENENLKAQEEYASQQHSDFLRNIRGVEGVLRGVDQLVALQQGGGSWWQKALAYGAIGLAGVASFGTAFAGMGVATAAKYTAVAGALQTGARIGGVSRQEGQTGSAVRGGGRIVIQNSVVVDQDAFDRGVGNAVLGS